MSDPETSKAASKASVPPSDNELDATRCAVFKSDASFSPDKPERTPIVEFKNGKVIFKQKPVSFEKQSQTLQEIVIFRAMLEERISNKEPPLSSFPEEHLPLIAKLGHESDKTLAALAKHIHHELLPTLDEDEDNDVASATLVAFPINLVETAIHKVLLRNNYGIDVPLGVKQPAAISVWRWEVRLEHLDWLPKNSREKAETRLAERIQAKEDLRIILESSPTEERDAIIDPKGSNKLPTKELNKPSTSQTSDAKGDDKGTPQSTKKQGKKKAEDVENDNQNDPKARVKKVLDPEKAAKEKEKQEKKAAKLEREKKEKEAHNKSQSLMAKFFTKPKSPVKPVNDQPSAVAGPSKMQSEFEKVFKPFVLQKDKVLAPVNWFKEEKKQKRRTKSLAPGTEVIVLDDSDDDDSDVEMLEPQLGEHELASMSNQERLRNILDSLPLSAPSKIAGSSKDFKLGRKAGFKVYNPVSVRDLVAQLSEAEISGNDDLVRSILAKLNDRELLPAKAFCFHTDARPGYYGTWTRSSRIIGPRRPFAKDTLVFDYSYDSGEEWEEEPVGEDVVEDGDEEDGDAEEADSDLDSWLVDDDEEPADLAALRDASPPPLDVLAPPQIKRKAEDGERKIGKKRKVVVPLVPFAKGSMFETTIGKCEYEPFKPYAIQLFNDTPYSVDPFTFVSTCVDDYKTFLRSANTTTTASNTTESSEAVFAVPALPPRLTGTMPNSDLSSNNASNAPGRKKTPTAPKSLFPEAHTQLLLDKITQLQASSITALVESIHLELREHKVKKNAIENKVREVGEKCKDKKVWVIKPALLQQQNPVV